MGDARGIAERAEGEEGGKPQHHGGSENQPDDGRTDAREECLDATVAEQVFKDGCDEQNDEKGGEHDAERRDKRAGETRLRRADKGRHVDGERPRGGFRHGNHIEKFRFRQPPVGEHLLPHKGNHAVAAAERDGADEEKGQKQVEEDHFASPPRRALRIR